MAKDPSFPFYASDWLGSTVRALMTPAQRGAYIDLLAHQWGDETCSLEDDDMVLAALSDLNEGWLQGGSQLLRRCFPAHPTLEGRIANPRMLEIRAERDEWRAKSAAGGRKSQEAQRLRRKKGGSTTLATKGATKGQPKGNTPSPSPSPSSKKKKPPIVPQGTPDPFTVWWGTWPAGRKNEKKAAQRAYIKAVAAIGKERDLKPAESRAYLQDRLEAFVATPKCKGDYCPYPATWLNKGRYDDDPAAWQAAGPAAEQLDVAGALGLDEETETGENP